ncbi:MAG: universal stress protein [Syntrophales bacterium]|jgi:nucleotide-binding universal stress UspA family protein|nr:universal stress protein [Syntrophales bacterium]
MFSRFIIATDLSLASSAVINCIGGLRAYGAKHCLLLQCLSIQEASSIAASYTTAQIECMLKDHKRILEQQGFSVETKVLPGFAKREINRIARKEGYSLIVIGSRGHSMVTEALLGGVAYDVVQQACKPILIVRLEKKQIEGNVRIQASRCDFSGHVLFPTDFSENADLVFTYLEKLLSDDVRHVTLLHVQDKTRIDPHLKHRLEEFNEIDRVRLEKMKETLKLKGNSDIDIELVHGAPFTEIMRVIQDRDVNLVVMGSQGRGFVKELFLGSVSHNVARNSEASVLLIPAKR